MFFKLPPELLIDIFSYLLPPSRSIIAFPPSASGTKDLLSLTLVCKTTHHIANHILIKRCLYLKIEKATKRLTQVLARYGRENGENGLVVEPTQAIIPAKGKRFDGWGEDELPYRNLYMYGNSYHMGDKVFDAFFSRVGNSLTRLVINTTFGVFLHGQHCHIKQCIVTIRNSFQQLKALEEFYCLQRNIYVLCACAVHTQMPLWTCWPKLQRLALADVYIDSEIFIEALNSLESLTHLCLMAPTLLRFPLPPVSCPGPRTIKQLMVIGFGERFSLDDDTFLGYMKVHRMDRSTDTPGRILILDASRALPPRDTFRYGRDSSQSQEWFLGHIQQGTLWDLEHTKDVRKEVEVYAGVSIS